MTFRERARRTFDVVVSIAALVTLAPVFAAAALWILACDGRPVFFRQRRAGKDNRLFEILKFRTMIESGATPAIESGAAPAVTAAGDARITSPGKTLRRFKLDELPQLFNVLKGEMSLIGPRPEVPCFIDADQVFWKKLLQVKPGITDLATLLFRDEEEILASAPDPEEVYRQEILPVKLRLNVRYLTRRTWRSDVRLLWLSLFYSLFPAKFDRDRIARSFGILEADLRAGGPRPAARHQELSVQGNR